MNLFIYDNNSGKEKNQEKISLKLANKFTYLKSSISSTENDISTRLAKLLTSIDRLSCIWKSYLSDEIKCSFFPSSGRICTTTWLQNMDADYEYREKAWGQLHYEPYWTSPGSDIPQSISCTTTNFPSLKPSKLDERGMWDIALECWLLSKASIKYHFFESLVWLNLGLNPGFRNYLFVNEIICMQMI